jgi:hypothetical protein
VAQNSSAKSQRQSVDRSTRQSASQRIREAETVGLRLPMVGQIRIARPDHLAYYGGLAALAALQLIEWPIALVLGAGHVLAESHHSRLAQELGDAFEQA